MTQKTGWPPGLLQDDHRGLSIWLSTRLDARVVVRRVCAELEEKLNEREIRHCQGSLQDGRSG
jgi:hypothetical protein